MLTSDARGGRDRYQIAGLLLGATQNRNGEGAQHQKPQRDPQAIDNRHGDTDSSSEREGMANNTRFSHGKGADAACPEKTKGSFPCHAPGKDNQVEVMWGSPRDKWDQIGDFGPMVMSLDEALEYINKDRTDNEVETSRTLVSPSGITLCSAASIIPHPRGSASPRLARFPDSLGPR